MVFEHLVPMKREEWSFFDRQRSIFSSMHKDMESEWKDFDMELEKIRKEMFTLSPAPSVDFGSMAGAMDFPKMGSGIDMMRSEMSTTTSQTTTTSMSSDMSKMSSDMSKLKSDMLSMADSGFGNMDSQLLKIERPFVTDMDGNKKLSIRFDVSQFKPEEITVRTLDNKLMIQAKHTEESPGRKVYREFSKQYILPNKIDPVKLESILSKDGVLNIEAPAPEAVEAPRERILPIQRL